MLSLSLLQTDAEQCFIVHIIVNCTWLLYEMSFSISSKSLDVFNQSGGASDFLDFWCIENQRCSSLKEESIRFRLYSTNLQEKK